MKQEDLAKKLTEEWMRGLQQAGAVNKTLRKVYTIAAKMDMAQLNKIWDTTIGKPTEEHHKTHPAAYEKYKSGEFKWRRWTGNSKRYLLEHAIDFKGKGVLKKNKGGHSTIEKSLCPTERVSGKAFGDEWHGNGREQAYHIKGPYNLQKDGEAELMLIAVFQWLDNDELNKLLPIALKRAKRELKI